MLGTWLKACSVPEEVCKSLCSEGTVVVTKHARARTCPRGCTLGQPIQGWAHDQKDRSIWRNPIQSRGKQVRSKGQNDVTHMIPTSCAVCHLMKGIERVWVKLAAKIRTAETRKRREKKSCKEFSPATKGEQVRTVKNVKEAGKKKYHTTVALNS